MDRKSAEDAARDMNGTDINDQAISVSLVKPSCWPSEVNKCDLFRLYLSSITALIFVFRNREDIGKFVDAQNNAIIVHIFRTSNTSTW